MGDTGGAPKGLQKVMKSLNKEGEDWGSGLFLLRETYSHSHEQDPIIHFQQGNANCMH